MTRRAPVLLAEHAKNVPLLEGMVAWAIPQPRAVAATTNSRTSDVRLRTANPPNDDNPRSQSASATAGTPDPWRKRRQKNSPRATIRNSGMAKGRTAPTAVAATRTVATSPCQPARTPVTKPKWRAGGGGGGGGGAAFGGTRGRSTVASAGWSASTLRWGSSDSRAASRRGGRPPPPRTPAGG